LEKDSLTGYELSSNKSRKLLPFESDAWKVILHCKRIELQSDFLQKSQEDLHGKDSIETMFLVSLSTI